MSQLNCPHCAQPYQLTPEQWPQYEGRTITCTRCSQPFMVSGSAGAPVATAVATSTPPAGAGYAAPAGYAPPGAYGPPGGFAPPGYGGPPGAPPGGFYPPPAAKKGAPWLVAVIILAVLLVIGGLAASIVLPAFSRARSAAQRAKCAVNMRQIGNACMMYANNNKDHFPPKLSDVARDQLVFDGNVFICPGTTDTPATGGGKTLAANVDAGGHLSYVYMGGGMRMSRVRSLSTTVLLYEPLSDHSDGANFLFVDGHVEFIEKEKAQRMIRNLENGKNPPTGLGS